MEFQSEEMVFTRDELQYIANGLACSPEMGGNNVVEFAKVCDLLSKINEQIDRIDCMQCQN